MIKIFFKYISFSILLPDILQEGSVVRVLEVLSGPFVEARVKQSALTQLSVMTEDSRLHQVFIDQSGVEVFIKMLHKVVVSRICILKDYLNIGLFHPQSLSSLMFHLILSQQDYCFILFSTAV